MAYDIENLLSDVKGILTSNFNTKLTAITSEKGDSITLTAIDSSSYFFQTMNDRTANFVGPFILYGIEDLKSIPTPRSCASATEVLISILVIVADQGQDLNIMSRMLRYSRALKEVIEENFRIVECCNSLEVQSLVPVPFQDINTGEPYRAVGILLKTVLG